MSDREYRVAKAAWLPIKQQPGFLAMAQRTLESYKAADREKAPQVIINAERVEVAAQFNYPVRDLDE